MFKAILYAAIRNMTLAAGRKGIEDALNILARDIANETAADTQAAQSILDRVGIEDPAMPHIPAPKPAIQQASTPAIAPAPAIQLNSRRAIRLLDIPPRRTTAPSQPALIQSLGVMGACVVADLDKLSAHDFAQSFPRLCPERGSQNQYYALTKDDGLAWIVVDHGTANPFSLCKKLKKIIARRHDIPAFRDAILAGGFFSIVLAVPSVEKQVEVEALLAQDPPKFVPVRVVVVSSLIPLMIERTKK